MSGTSATHEILVGVFERPSDILAATRAARDHHASIADAYTPFAVHGLEKAMGLPRSRLPKVCFALGLAGAAAKVVFEYWASAVDWPINVGGKPWNSLPAFIPLTFEVMVLFAGVGTAVAFLLVTGLRPWRQVSLPDPRATDDRFVLVLNIMNDADTVALESLLGRFNPIRVERRPVNEVL